MTREFVFTKPFLNCRKAMGLSDSDLIELEKLLLANPQGGARKMRISLDRSGKSGDGRVIYLDVFEKERLYLLFAYSKNVQENLTADQKKAIKQLVDAIKKE